MKIYTRGGDQGMTSLIGGRVAKNNIKVETYGTLDELNSYVGLAAALAEQEATSILSEQLTEIMHECFDAGSDLAYAANPQSFKLEAISVTRLEQWIDEHTEECPQLTKFILPSGSQLAATLHICRTVCRRAERQMVTLMNDEHDVNQVVLAYLNRLSDYFFAAARRANMLVGVEDTVYVRSADVFKGTTKK